MRYRGIRFDQTSNSKEARRIIQGLDKKSAQIRFAIKTLQEAISADYQLAKMSHNFNTGVRYKDLLWELKVLYDHFDGRLEAKNEKWGVFDTLM